MTTPADLDRATSELSRAVVQLRESVDVAAALRDDISRVRVYGLRSRRLIAGVCAGLVMDLALTGVAGGLYLHQRQQSVRIERVQRTTSESVRADCAFFAPLAAMALPPRVTTFGLRIIAGSRNAYVGHGCVARLGRLPAADSRLRPYLTPGA